MRKGTVMKTNKIPGGIHPLCARPDCDHAVQVMPAPDHVVIPMLRTSGAPLTPLVRRGDFVFMGQKIGDSEAYVSAPVHASVSGKVIRVEPRPHPGGKRMVLSVVIENDHKDTWDESCMPTANEPDGAEIVRLAREKGVVGMGGATFPAHVKLSPPAGKVVDVLIANGAECEPVLCADDALMCARAAEVIGGMRLAMKALKAERGIVGIEEDKPEAIRAMRAAAEGTGITVAPLHVRYPQGGEKQLIYALTGRRVATGALPSDAGCAVFNVGTLAALHNAVALGRPVVDRIVTVAGCAVRSPRNVLARIGTSFKDCIEFCGGYVEAGPAKLISGGPMMGIAMYTDEVPVIAGTSGILALPESQARVPEPSACLHCGRCHLVCPMNLQPYAIEDALIGRDAGRAARFGAQHCIECGACSYICPARRHLVQNIRLAKALVRGSAAGQKP